MATREEAMGDFTTRWAAAKHGLSSQAPETVFNLGGLTRDIHAGQKHCGERGFSVARRQGPLEPRHIPFPCVP